MDLLHGNQKNHTDISSLQRCQMRTSSHKFYSPKRKGHNIKFTNYQVLQGKEEKKNGLNIDIFLIGNLNIDISNILLNLVTH